MISFNTAEKCNPQVYTLIVTNTKITVKLILHRGINSMVDVCNMAGKIYIAGNETGGYRPILLNTLL